MKPALSALAAVLALAAPLCAHASLGGRDLDGDPSTVEGVYDSNAGITWLADLQAGPLSSWRDASHWAAGLTLGGTSGWRLARADEFRPLYRAWRDATSDDEWLQCAFGDDRSGCRGATVGIGSALFSGFGRRGQQNWFADSPLTQQQFILYGLPGPFEYGQWGSVHYYGGFDPTGDDGGSPFLLDASGIRLRGLAVVDGDVGAVVASVPEPGTWASMLAGLLASGVAAGRRRRARRLQCGDER